MNDEERRGVVNIRVFKTFFFFFFCTNGKKSGQGLTETVIQRKDFVINLCSCNGKNAMF